MEGSFTNAFFLLKDMQSKGRIVCTYYIKETLLPYAVGHGLDVTVLLIAVSQYKSNLWDLMDMKMDCKLLQKNYAFVNKNYF